MPLLEVLDVTVRFGGVTAINSASFVAEQGRVTGLIGPNGAGKTTMFNVITGIQTPTEGSVRFDGHDITDTATHQRARLGIARTFQRLEAFGSLTVWENVLCAAEIHKKWHRSAPDPVTVARDLIHEVGIEAVVDAPADAVPTGQARLLELARALAIEPKLLLLDEPSSGLGDEETDALGVLLRRLADAGTTVLMVEHDMDLVMSICDSLNVLDFGSIIARGEPAAIRADPIVQKAYLGVAVPDSTVSAGTVSVGMVPDPTDPIPPGATFGVPRRPDDEGDAGEQPPATVDAPPAAVRTPKPRPSTAKRPARAVAGDPDREQEQAAARPGARKSATAATARVGRRGSS